MPNILRIDWNMNRLDLSLINVKRYEVDAVKNGELLEQVSSTSLGIAMFNGACCESIIHQLGDSYKSLFLEILFNGSL